MVKGAGLLRFKWEGSVEVAWDGLVRSVSKGVASLQGWV